LSPYSNETVAQPSNRIGALACRVHDVSWQRLQGDFLVKAALAVNQTSVTCGPYDLNRYGLDDCQREKKTIHLAPHENSHEDA